MEYMTTEVKEYSHGIHENSQLNYVKIEITGIQPWNT